MRNYMYSFYIPRKNEDKEYYLFYKKRDSKIIVYLADGRTKEFPDSKEIEIKIIERMEAQIKRCESDFSVVSSDDSEDIIIRSGQFVVISSAFTFIPTANSPFFLILNYMVLGMSSIALSYGSLGYYRIKKLKEDYEKHKLYLDNKELIKDGIWKDLRPISGINKRARKEAKENLKSDIDPININTIRLLNISEIKGIIANIENKNKVYSLKRE